MDDTGDRDGRPVLVAGFQGEDISAGEYVADDDRNASAGYCALPHHAHLPALRAHADQVRRKSHPRLEDDAAG